VIVTLGPRGEAAAALQALDGRPVVLEAAAVVHEPGQVMDLDGCQGLDYSRSRRARLVSPLPLHV